MSRSVNKVTLMGNLGADPEVRDTANGGRVTTISLATGRQWKNNAGEQQEKTQWHRVVLWDNQKGAKLATLAEKYMKKGDKLYVEGEIEYRTWEDKQGQTKYSTEIIAREVILMGAKDEGAERPAKAVAAAAGGKTDFGAFPEAFKEDEDDELPF